MMILPNILLTEYFNTTLELDKEIEQNIIDYFTALEIFQFLQTNVIQALLPKKFAKFYLIVEDLLVECGLKKTE